jgi:hypothetical protein
MTETNLTASAHFSLITFILSVISSIILIKFGLNKYKTENLIAGIFFIYISLANVFQYFILDDINDLVWSGNTIMSQISAIFIYTQPVVLYIIKLAVIQPASFNWIYASIEALFLLYALYCFNNYSKLQTIKASFLDKTSGLLEWSWLHYIDFIVYFSFFIFSIFIYIDFRYAILASIWLFSIIDLSYFIVPNYFGALYCIIAGLSPLGVLLWQIMFL